MIMSQIKNNQTIKELISAANIQTTESVPIKLGETILPTLEINPNMFRKCNIVRSSTGTTTGALTIYTVPDNQDFYLCGIQAAMYATTTCDIATGAVNISITIDGAVRNIIGIPFISTVTGANTNKSLYLPQPIKLDRGSSITFGGTYTAGTCIRIASIYGYTVENNQ